MSSDFERRLREAREALPPPGLDATERARQGAVKAAARRRHAGLRRLAVAVVLLVAVGVGVGIGALATPSGSAAEAPNGLGFLPERGWHVVQSGGEATPARPVVAIAANVPVSSEDGQSIVPYSTLLKLPPEGVVIVANFTGPERLQPVYVPYFPPRKLPLLVRDASPYIEWGGQIRPENPLAQYQLRAHVEGYAVDIHFYFGSEQPSNSLLEEAQRQLDGLIVRPQRSVSTARPKVRVERYGPDALLDQRFSCRTVLLGGVREVETRAHRGFRFGGEWTKLAYASISTGAQAGPLSGRTTAPPNSLAWIAAGSPAAGTTVDSEFHTFPVRASGTLGVNPAFCTRSSARIPLTSSGLRGGAAGQLVEEFDCIAPQRVLVRVRAVVRSESRLHRRGGFLSTREPLREAELVVRTEKGKPLVYARVFESGKAELLTARSCVRD